MSLLSFGQGIYAIDSGYVREGLAAIYLIVQNGRAAFVETGCNRSMPRVMAALQHLGIAPDAVDFVIPTHVHLDHAGGAGAMMHQFPNARLVVHPRGARHMADPSKLIAGTIGVYGAEETARLYGEILPIDANRIVEAGDGFSVSLAGRQLLCLDVPGHAKHHIAVIDDASGGIFTGDTFGLSYAELNGPDRPFVFPTTTPVQLDPPALHASMDRLLAYRPPALYLTHFGCVTDVSYCGEVLHRQVEAFVQMVQQIGATGELRQQELRNAMAAFALSEARAVGCDLPNAQILTLLSNDIDLNTQGLCVWAEGQAAAS